MDMKAKGFKFIKIIIFQADSGGPLVYNNKQIGIVSFGFDICGVKPGVYSKIRPLRDWILDTMGANL